MDAVMTASPVPFPALSVACSPRASTGLTVTSGLELVHFVVKSKPSPQGRDVRVPLPPLAIVSSVWER